MHMKSFVYISIALLSLASCSVDLYTSEFKEQEEHTIDVDVSESFDGTNPVFVSASKGAYTDRIVVSWSSVPGADYYEIERAEEGSEDFVALTAHVYGKTSFADVADDANTLMAGKQYVYRVYARSNTKSANFGSTVTASATGSMLAVPGNVDASNEYTGYVMVKWDQVADAIGYKIYKQDSLSDPDFRLAGSVSSGSQTNFRYDVPASETGDTIYFAVKAVGSNNVTTELSNYSFGNSLVPGAPSQPTNLTADQGKAVEYSPNKAPIVLTWDKPGSGTDDYIIYRSAPGQSEKQVYPYGSNDKSPKQEGSDKCVFADTRGRNEIMPGVRYTYTVIPTGTMDGKQIKGSPAVIDAYLLSNPSDVKLSLQKEPAAYVVSFSQAVGLDTAEDRKDHADWSYIINMKTVNGAEDTLPPVVPGDYDDYISVAVPYNTSEAADDQYTIFNVQVDNGTLKTNKTSDLTITRPGVPENFAVGQNRYEEDMKKKDTNGIYPVRLSWKKNSNIDHYEVTITSADGSQDLGSATIVGSKASYDAVYPNAKVGEKYRYTIKAVDVLGREGDASEPEIGYGALTGDKFIEVWSAYAFKPFLFVDSLPTSANTDYQAGFNLQNYWRNAEIGKKVEKGNSSSLSTQMDALTGGSYIYNYCHYGHGSHSGTPGNESSYGRMGYSASTEGIGGQIYFTYEDFGELSYMYTNGEYEMHVDASGTGSAKSGSGGFTVEGMYPAQISLGNITVKSKAFSGQYSVRMKDGQGTLKVTAR